LEVYSCVYYLAGLIFVSGGIFCFSLKILLV
jgi:hypothetical protein